MNAAPVGEGQGAPAPDEDTYTVLVVEDEATHQMLIRKVLEHDGSAFSLVQFTRDSEEALRFARQMSFDVLLVDNRIPGTRGLDLLTELREAGVAAPFVLMTSAGSEDLVVQAYRKNVDDYVIKDSGFWKDLPQILMRVIKSDRLKKREHALLDRLARTNEKLDQLHADVQRKNAQVVEKVKQLKDAIGALGDAPPAVTAAGLVAEIEALL